ncbi:AraC family transcriptional regulator [Alkalihalobacillus oceani]|uniref:AraC family transcriptional regulator n=1 Tax=Halalkalibacter oceani TaxID=1653776 RepID=A0A9X2DS29_9BACI|nr:AraC family transcriptional regulator [Halalkalibacter oceani]MCM3715110.1 AraC family transcriptional regulator [Halalkalibacter oceani]
MKDWTKEKAVDQVLDYIHNHLDAPLSLEQLASEAAYSPYHFSRLFKERTGLSPHYYIASLRLQHAKELLLTTNLTIRDIGMEIGQQSLGTFTTRFTERVGMTPAFFRRSEELTEQLIGRLQDAGEWKALLPVQPGGGVVEGSIQSAHPISGVILVGLFTKPIPEGLPAYGTLLASPGEFSFSGVEPGTYFLLATSVEWGTAAQSILVPHETLRCRSPYPIIISGRNRVPYQALSLHPPRIGEPPILISLPILMKKFLSEQLLRKI